MFVKFKGLMIMYQAVESMWFEDGCHPPSLIYPKEPAFMLRTVSGQVHRVNVKDKAEAYEMITKIVHGMNACKSV